MQRSKDSRVPIEWNISLPEIKRPDIIKARRMVAMFVGEKDSIQLFYIFPQHLLSEIRAAIDHITRVIPFHHHRYPETLIPRVTTSVYRVLTAYHRYAL